MRAARREDRNTSEWRNSNIGRFPAAESMGYPQRNKSYLAQFADIALGWGAPTFNLVDVSAQLYGVQFCRIFGRGGLFQIKTRFGIKEMFKIAETQRFPRAQQKCLALDPPPK